jgi:hypothetical protein
MTTLVLCLGLLGCESTPILDKHYGDATRANKERMIANPEAGMEPNDGVIEIEGATVENSLKRYRREQTQAPKRNLPQSILLQGAPSSR